MPELLQDWLDAPLRTLPERVLIYGAGTMGTRVARVLKARGVVAEAMLDRNAQDDLREGLPVCTAASWISRHPGGCRAVILAMHNPAHDIGDVEAELRQQGFGPIFTLVDVCNIFPEDFDDCFWLAPRSFYKGHGANLRALDRLLDDEPSRQLLSHTLAFRLGNQVSLPHPEPRQYVPETLPRWPERLRIVDCGAYDGDTLRMLHDAGYAIEAAVCLEPDPHNYVQLVRHVCAHAVSAICLPCAASDAMATLRFNAVGGSSSHAQDDGAISVQAVALDEAFPAFAPNLVKMDIEGAEQAALRGARHMLERHRPALAISLYHRPADLWEIPFLLAGWLKNYRFSIRSHGYNTFELVLYARPRAN